MKRGHNDPQEEKIVRIEYIEALVICPAWKSSCPLVREGRMGDGFA